MANQVVEKYTCETGFVKSKIQKKQKKEKPSDRLKPRGSNPNPPFGRLQCCLGNGHVSYVANINKKDSCMSDPFRSGDGKMIGTDNNYLNRE